MKFCHPTEGRRLTRPRHCIKGVQQVCASCVKSRLLYGSETWLMKVTRDVKLDITEILMSDGCVSTLKERKKSGEIELFRSEPVSVVINNGLLTVKISTKRPEYLLTKFSDISTPAVAAAY